MFHRQFGEFSDPLRSICQNSGIERFCDSISEPDGWAERDEENCVRFSTWCTRSYFLKSIVVYDFRPIRPKVIAI
jgi:hypothetical protein